MRILVVEDEAAISRMLRDALEDTGYSVVTAEDGDTAVTLATSEMFHLIILDLMLPGKDGWQVCEELRLQRVNIPILMLTARDAVGDRVKGLDLGADDYLPKPFDINELLARVRALLRRDKMHKTRLITVDDLEIDCDQRRVRRAGKEIFLSPREYTLVEALASHEGTILSRETILESVWNCSDTFSNTVNVYVGMLRKKVDTGHAHRLIHTVHGAGYMMLRRQ